MADDKPTDGNTKQWDKLQQMRRKSGTALTDEGGKPADGVGSEREAEQRASAEAIKAEQERLQAGAAVGGDDPEPEEEEAEVEETDEPADEPEPEKVVVKEHERAKPKAKEAKPADETPPDGCEFVEIDGKRVAVDKSLAEAYRASETAKVETAKTTTDKAVVDEIVARVTAALPKQDTPAAKAVTDAVKAIDDEPMKHPMPDGKLSVSDPDEYNKQLQAHIDEKADRTTRKILAERDAKAAADSAEARTHQAAREIAHARETLSLQFYKQFKVLDDPDIRPVVDVLLNKKIDDVIASGAVDKPLPPKEGEALKMRVFNDVAAAATRQIVKLRGKSTSAEVTPAPTPPNLATSKPTGAKPKVTTAPAAKPKEKYPARSVSAALAAHKAAKEGRSKPAA